MFFVAYSKDGEDVKTRPISFLYNGGPGAATIWLIYAVSVHPSHWSTFHSPDIVFPLLIGVWLVVKGALRASSY